MMKLKLEEEYSLLKLWFMCNIWELDSFYVFLLILLVLILLSVSSHFLWLQIVEVTLTKNRLNTVSASDSIQQDRLPVSWKLVEYTFNH